MGNIKLHILERDKDLIMESEIPLSQENNLFENKKHIQNLVLSNAIRNFQNIRDSISLQKERNKKYEILKKTKTPKKKKKKTPKKKRKKTKTPKKKKKKTP